MSEPMPAPEDVVCSWGCVCPDDEGHDPESGCRYGQPRGVSVHAWREQAEQLHTTRQRLTDLQGEYELTKANFTDFAEQQLERNRQHAQQIEEMDRVVSLANTTAAEARQRLADLEWDARNVLSCLHAGNVTTAESLLRHALDQDTARDGDP